MKASWKGVLFFMPKIKKKQLFGNSEWLLFYIHNKSTAKSRKGIIMKDRLAKLLTVKSIITIAMTIVFCVLAIRGTLSGQEFLTIFTTVIAFYFGTQKIREEKVE